MHGLDPLAAPSQKIWGYETTWGSFAQFCKVQAQQCLPKPTSLTWEEAASYGLTYFAAYRMLIDQAKIQSGDRVLIWAPRAGSACSRSALPVGRGGLRRDRLLRRQGRAVPRARGLRRDRRNDFAGMMRRGGETPEEEAARGKESRRFAKHVRTLLGASPDVVFEHVGRATFPTSVLTVKPFGKVVICGATSGCTLDFDVRHLWMRQKQILGSHFANAYKATRANELIESGKIRPVLWKTMPFDGVAAAHQSMYKNEHLGKIAILVGAEAEGLGATAEGPGAIRAEVGA